MSHTLNVRQLGGSGGILPGKYSNLDLLKLSETCIFLFIFASSKLSRSVTKLHQRGHFARAFEKWGHVPTVPPAPTSITDNMNIQLSLPIFSFSLELLS